MSRRDDIVTAAAGLFARSGYAAVGMDNIGVAAGITGPAIYRHFPSKAAVLAAVIAQIIEVVAAPADGDLPALIETYAAGVASRRELMGVFVREVHHLPDEHRRLLEESQRALVGRWRLALSAAHPDWPDERVRTAVHACFGLLNSVATFRSPLSDAELAAELSRLARRILR